MGLQAKRRKSLVAPPIGGATHMFCELQSGSSRGTDLNCRPLGYEPSELPDCSTPRFDASRSAWSQPLGEADGVGLGEGEDAAC